MVFSKKKSLIALWPACFLLAGIFLLTSCVELEKSKYYTRHKDSGQLKESTENVTISYTDSGKLKAQIKSPLLSAVKDVSDPFLEMSKGLAVDFFDDNRVRKSWLAANYGISYSEKKMIIVREKVEIMNIKGEKLQTEELIWDQKTQRIRTDKNVTITTRDKIFHGEGMESNQTFTDWEIKKLTGTISTYNAENDSVARAHTVEPRSSRN